MINYKSYIGPSAEASSPPAEASVDRSLRQSTGTDQRSIGSIQDAPYPSTKTDAAQPTEAIFGPLSLLPDQIDAPAFFVDDNLSVRWIATGGTDPFTTALTQELRTTASRNVFNLLLRPAIKHAMTDWRSFFSFVYTSLGQTTATGAETTPEKPSITGKQASPSGHGNFFGDDRSAFTIDSCLIGTDEPPYRVFCLTFDKGTLFMLRQDCWIKENAIPTQAVPVAEASQPASQKKTICVLSARLNHAHRLAKSMLPDLFMRLMDRLWAEADDIIRSLGGNRAGCNGPRLCYVFSENAGRDPIFSAICCATRLNRQMLLLEEKLHAQYGWNNEICLNMGIGHGTGVQKESDASPSSAFVVPGGAFDQAALLSGMAGKGEIWITQAAAAQLPSHLIDRVVLGIDHQGRFLRNFFKPISDIEQIQPVIQANPDMAVLSVSQIKALERPMPARSLTIED